MDPLETTVKHVSGVVYSQCHVSTVYLCLTWITSSGHTILFARSFVLWRETVNEMCYHCDQQWSVYKHF